MTYEILYILILGLLVEINIEGGNEEEIYDYMVIIE